VVDLAEVPAPDLVGRAVADTLRVDAPRPPARDDAEALVEALVDVLVDRPPSVLLLDNCEHVVEACGPLVDQVLRRCSDVRVLATSRRPLGVAAEHVLAVPPLAEQHALRLLVERARQATAGLHAEPMASLEVVRLADICRELDGLPLAVELVASQLRARAPAEVGSRLGDLLRFRRAGAAAAGPLRQRSLHDMAAWSHELLPPATRPVFARLGVFTGSLTLEGAEAVCSADGLVASGDVLEHVTTLVDHSLLLRDRRAAAATRYRMVHPVRLFALEQLAAAEAVAPARRAHARFHLALAESAGPHLCGPSERIWQRRLADEEPELRAAMTWSARHEPATAARMAGALWPYWAMTWGDPLAVDDLAPLLCPRDAGVELAEDLRAWTLTVAADLAAHAGDARRAVPWAEEAVAAFRRLEDGRGLACALVALGSARVSGGALADAHQVLTTARELARRHGDPAVIAKALRALALVALRRGDGERAAELVHEERLWWTELGSRRGEADALGRLAVVTLHLGDHVGAADLCHRTIARLDGRDDPVAIAYVRMTLADIARERGDVGAAAELYEQVLEDLRLAGDRRGSASALMNLATLSVGQGEPQRGAGLFRQAIALRHELGDDAGLVELIEGLALTFAADQRHGHAVTLLTATSGTREQAGSPAPASGEIAAAIAAARAQLGADRFAAQCRLGRGLPVDEAVVYALAAR
jgi:predicted ATPase